VDFVVLVTDAAGNETSQSFTVAVLASAPAAGPFTIGQARSETGLGQTYLGQISGSDALGRPVEFSLVSGPAGIEVDSDGTLQFTPTTIGTQTIELLASSVDGETENVVFDVEVLGQPVIVIPSIASEPLLSATVNNEYRYDVELENADGELLSFELVEGPIGASIDPDRGTLRFTPELDQLGEADFAIEVTLTDGQSVTQEFTLNVSRVGGPPLIISTPPTEANVGGSYLYSVDAVDSEGNPLTFRISQGPSGLTINENTGEISWTPGANQTGLRRVVIEVVDGFGGASTQAFAILVGDGVVNEAPVIESEAPRFTAVGSDYSYQCDRCRWCNFDRIFPAGCVGGESCSCDHQHGADRIGSGR